MSRKIHYMKNSLIALSTCLFIMAAQSVDAQEGVRYRDFALGSDVATVAKLAGAPLSDVKLVHERPAVMQELEWRPRYVSGDMTRQTDPVKLMVFRFYEGQLVSVTVDYDRYKTEGMSDADMIDAITSAYGPVSKVLPAPNRISLLSYGVADEPVAIWQDTESSVTLLRVAYPASFKLVVTSTRLDNLARTASTEAVRLDAKEAPQREAARQQKESDEALAALKKAKTENKAVFRP